MTIDCVTVCVNYSDFLAHTLPYNRIHFDRMVVVTDTKDKDTKNLCDFYHVECIQTDVFYENGDNFNKAKGINEGIKALNPRAWVLHLDADIYLPPLTRGILERAQLDPSFIYGIDRMMCGDFESWMQFICKPQLTHEGWIYVHPTVFPMGVRIAEYMGGGYEPIGFFQLWNPLQSSVYFYPEQHGAADRTDVLFAKQFPRAKRSLIPEVIAIHLESENLDLVQMGKNWNGRKTKVFGFDGKSPKFDINKQNGLKYG